MHVKPLEEPLRSFVLRPGLGIGHGNVVTDQTIEGRRELLRGKSCNDGSVKMEDLCNEMS